ncbi:cytochrome P450 3A28-like [Centruroides vittatus]|uniref:cytochrome P450 3A28-like n=1 Tax=Centruroides vittatus TaxID=120091 RepID=UPI00350FD54D
MFSFLYAIILVTVICLTFLWIRWRINKLNVFKRCGIPGPEPEFLTGNLKEFNLDRMKCTKEWFEKYGKIFGFFLGAKPYIMCSDIEFLKIMQIKEFKNFCGRDRILPDMGISHESVKYIMALQKGIKWKNIRSVMTNCFTSQKIKMMSTAIHDPTVAFIEKIKKENGKPLDIAQSYKGLVFNIMVKLLFSAKFNEENEEYNKIVHCLDYLLQNDIVKIPSNRLSCK